MNPEEITKEFVLSEVGKLQYLYGLKHEIRYGQKRPEGDLTESVAEHIYGMHLLAHYFLPLENPTSNWNALRVFSMITIHDLDEIETGDTITYLKSEESFAAEKVAREKVIIESPLHFQKQLQGLSDEYESRETIEAKFVKAIDAFEPLIQIYNSFGREIIHINKTSPEQSEISKENPIKPFPTMYRYYKIIHQAMIDEGFFYPEN